ncbi:hypothetical protein QTP88_015682 [Uroleucon formosanum]
MYYVLVTLNNQLTTNKVITTHQLRIASVVNNKMIAATDSKESSIDEMDLFFKSIAISVKKLPYKGKTEAKLGILSLVAQLEDKYLDDAGAQPTQPMFQTLFRSTTDYNNIISLSSTPSPCFSSSSATPQGFEPYMYNE